MIPFAVHRNPHRKFTNSLFDVPLWLHLHILCQVPMTKDKRGSQNRHKHIQRAPERSDGRKFVFIFQNAPIDAVAWPFLDPSPTEAVNKRGQW